MNMAKVSEKQSEKVYVLELTEREANALTEVLVATNQGSEGEGYVLADIYWALCDAGAESDKCAYTVEDDQVFVTRVG
jgi:hypothetical protein